MRNFNALLVFAVYGNLIWYMKFGLSVGWIIAVHRIFSVLVCGEICNINNITVSYRDGLVFSWRIPNNCNELNLFESGIDEHQILYLIKALKFSNQLRGLNLDRNTINDFGVELVSNSVNSNHLSHLEYLSIGHNNISDHSAVSLFRSLRSHEFMVSLDIKGNNISDASAVDIVSMVTSMRSLKYLNLERNFLTVEAIEQLEAQVLNRNMEIFHDFSHEVAASFGETVPSAQSSTNTVSKILSILAHKCDEGVFREVEEHLMLLGIDDSSDVVHVEDIKGFMSESFQLDQLSLAKLRRCGRTLKCLKHTKDENIESWVESTSIGHHGGVAVGCDEYDL